MTNVVPNYAVHKDGLIAGFFGQFRFLSNFYVLKNGVTVDDLCFPSVENCYQAMKWPPDKRTQFLDVTPSQSKKLGKNAPINIKEWDKKKFEIMQSLVLQKFTNNNELKEMLLATDGYVLEERNSWHDLYWGTNVDGIGENNLGKILMDVREKLKLDTKH